jgi:hypothetical protein
MLPPYFFLPEDRGDLQSRQYSNADNLPKLPTLENNYLL